MATTSALTLCHVSPQPHILVSPCPSSSPSPSLSFSPRCLPKRRSQSSLMVSASRVPMTPVDLSDPFISGLNSADSFDFWPKSRKDPDYLPYLDIVASLSSPPAPSRPKKSLQAVTTPTRIDENKLLTEPPPDLESKLLFGRVVYLCLPIVPAVSEMMIAQLLYLQGMNPNEPIYMYISSTGTARDDWEPVALESEGFAVYDTMMTLQNEVHTLLIGKAAGHACLLLSAGTKGKRYMLPHARALIQQPRIPAYGEMSTSDLVSRTREALIQRNKFVELLAKHTGNSFEKVEKMMRTPCYMDFEKAKELGFVDKMPVIGQDRIMADVPSIKEWDMRARIAEYREG